MENLVKVLDTRERNQLAINKLLDCMDNEAIKHNLEVLVAGFVDSKMSHEVETGDYVYCVFKLIDFLREVKPVK
jgi:hypothetical protein